VLHDCMIGDRRCFNGQTWWKRDGAVSQSRARFVEGAAAREIFQLRLGPWGPKEADELLERDGRRWRKLREMIMPAILGEQRSTGILSAQTAISAWYQRGFLPAARYSELGEIVSSFWQDAPPGLIGLLRNCGSSAHGVSKHPIFPGDRTVPVSETDSNCGHPVDQ